MSFIKELLALEHNIVNFRREVQCFTLVFLPSSCQHISRSIVFITACIMVKELSTGNFQLVMLTKRERKREDHRYRQSL